MSFFLLLVFGCEVPEHKQLLFSLPVCFGGLGVPLPTLHVSAQSIYKAPRDATCLIVGAIKGTALFYPSEHYDAVLNALPSIA